MASLAGFYFTLILHRASAHGNTDDQLLVNRLTGHLPYRDSTCPVYALIRILGPAFSAGLPCFDYLPFSGNAKARIMRR